MFVQKDWRMNKGKRYFRTETSTSEKIRFLNPMWQLLNELKVFILVSSYSVPPDSPNCLQWYPLQLAPCHRFSDAVRHALARQFWPSNPVAIHFSRRASPADLTHPVKHRLVSFHSTCFFASKVTVSLVYSVVISGTHMFSSVVRSLREVLMTLLTAVSTASQSLVSMPVKGTPKNSPICFRASQDCLSWIRLIETPIRPNRPVRPIRWRYVSVSGILLPVIGMSLILISNFSSPRTLISYIIDDQRDSLHIDTTSQHISGNEHLSLAAPEVIDDGISLMAFKPSSQRGNLMTWGRHTLLDLIGCDTSLFDVSAVSSKKTSLDLP